jgi:hypothetical protein
VFRRIGGYSFSSIVLDSEAASLVGGGEATSLALTQGLIRSIYGILDQHQVILYRLIERYGKGESHGQSLVDQSHSSSRDSNEPKSAGADAVFARSCPVVGASIGQHFRHSLDHIEQAVDAAVSKGQCLHGEAEPGAPRLIAYDRRVRGALDESDIHAALKRIELIRTKVDQFVQLTATNGNLVTSEPVSAVFMLSGDASEPEMTLPSTLARELGFVVHHAIHHLALVRILLLHTPMLGGNAGLLHPDEIPSDFGRAPSTVRFEASAQPESRSRS